VTPDLRMGDLGDNDILHSQQSQSGGERKLHQAGPEILFDSASHYHFHPKPLQIAKQFTSAAFSHVSAWTKVVKSELKAFYGPSQPCGSSKGADWSLAASCLGTGIPWIPGCLSEQSRHKDDDEENFGSGESEWTELRQVRVSFYPVPLQVKRNAMLQVSIFISLNPDQKDVAVFISAAFLERGLENFR